MTTSDTDAEATNMQPEDKLQFKILQESLMLLAFMSVSIFCSDSIYVLYITTFNVNTVVIS